MLVRCLVVQVDKVLDGVFAELDLALIFDKVALALLEVETSRYWLGVKFVFSVELGRECGGKLARHHHLSLSHLVFEVRRVALVEDF